MMAVAYDRHPPDFNRVKGRSMVDDNFIPLGFALAYFEPGPDGVVSIQAHFGKWFRKYPKDILRGLKVTIDELRDMGIKEVYSAVDTQIDGAFTLINWLGGVATGDQHEVGPIYRLSLATMKI